jgi:NAD(P)-dependent dehydrogenase (short-subunit alcohol dehydrogenase family)
MSEKPLLKDRVILITGAGRGIGRCHALLFAELGAKVVVNDFGGEGDGTGASSGPAQDVVNEIKAAGGEAVANFGDVSKEADAEAMVQQAIDTYGDIHAVVNNAGVLRDKTLLNLTVEDWEIVNRVNLLGTFLTTRAAGRHWRDQSKATGQKTTGRIVNTSSGSGIFGNFGQANYAAAKGGVASLTILTAIELGKYGVTANAIAPAAKTRLIGTIPGRDASLKEGYDPRDPAHISPLVAYLCSEEAGDVNAQIFGIQGEMVGAVEGYLPGALARKEGGFTTEDMYKVVPDLLSKIRQRPNIMEAWTEEYNGY